MRIIEHIREMQKFSDEVRASGRTLGLVPTMGYFHEGHVSLMRIARQVSVIAHHSD